MDRPSLPPLRLSGHLHLAHRLVLSLLSGRPLSITSIRPDADDPGLLDYEVQLLQLLEQVTNGTSVKISHTGTALTFVPGTIVNGSFTFAVGVSRPVGYFLEVLVALAPFGKKPLAATLSECVTAPDHRGDLSPDTVRTATLPYLSAAFGLDAGCLELNVDRRGAAPLGGGQVRLVVQPAAAAKLHPVRLMDAGRIKKIRGVASATRVSPALATRVANAARAVLTRYIPDVYVYADAARKDAAGKSPGFAVSLVASSTNEAVRYVADAASRARVADPRSGEEIRPAVNDPEWVGEQCARALLAQIQLAGCVDVAHEWLTLVYATVAGEEVSKWVQARRGEHGLDDISIQSLRDLKDFFNVQFKIATTPDGQIAISGVGAGLITVNKKFT
ncbi:RNA-3'-phosphate cyclase [Blastocladiella britannica]|nr:RNA-3'-phosphate cyclase [Blastocladiella britannica]